MDGYLKARTDLGFAEDFSEYEADDSSGGARSERSE
jgi:hypothetical protein